MKKQIINDKPVTKTDLRDELKQYATKQDLRDELKQYATKEDLENIFRKYRDDVLTKMDKSVGELAQIREDQLFMNHDIKQCKETDYDHEKRLTKLEKNPHTSN